MFNNQTNQADDSTDTEQSDNASVAQSPQIDLGGESNQASIGSTPAPLPVLPTLQPVPQEETTSPKISETITPTPELQAIKTKVLEDLSPLVDNLDQTPEEKYKTIMMLIQASDNHDLIQGAYEAAGKITDDKVRAEALLDIVNEINYLTQKS